MTSPSQNVASRWPHLFALLLAGTTFPLIWVGGLVTSYDAGMAVPDWPGTFGYNLFAYPWQTWFFGPWDLFIEHGHRLLGALVGLLAIGLAIAAWRYDRRPWLRGAAVGAVALVIAQGALGGARVLLDERLVALVHGCVGPLFFAWTGCLVVFTSRMWRESTTLEDSAGSSICRSAWLLVSMAFVQLAIGAVLRHVPVSAPPNVFRIAVWFHLLLAALLTVQIVLVARATLSGAASSQFLRRPALLLLALVGVQVVLGVITWVVKYSWPAWLGNYAFAAGYVVQEKSFLQSLSATAHVANGSLILFTATLLAVRASRLYGLKLPAAAGMSHSILGTAV